MTFYEQDGFTDLCRGPHLQSTKPIKAFKLTSLAGAYWRGDSSKQMLTRIYGTAFFDQAELDAHLERIEEARRRDHRRLGRELDLFHLSETSPGSPFWHPRGMVLFNELGRLWRELNASRGYEEVKTPILFGTELWKRSGHWDNYRDKMFLTEQVEGRQFGLKPMNCPGHVEIYNHRRHSYRDLPLRLAEQGLVHRNEDSGSMHGLLRVRHITQDDAHIFCRWDQVEAEVVGCLDLASVIYETFGLDVRAELSTRPEKRLGSEEEWDRMEAALVVRARDGRLGLRREPGRRRVLRAQDRPPHDRLDRPQLAGGHDPARRLDAAAARRDLHDERGSARAPVHDPPRAVRLVRALHRHPHRALRRRLPALARARAGRRAPAQRPSCATTPTRSSPRCAPRACAPSWTRARRRSGARSTTPRCSKVPVMLVLGGREAEARSVAVRRRGGVDLGRHGARRRRRAARGRGALARARACRRAALERPPLRRGGARGRPPAPPRAGGAHRGAHRAHERPHATRVDPLDAHLVAAASCSAT